MLRWLLPGMRVKRWLAIALSGLILILISLLFLLDIEIFNDLSQLVATLEEELVPAAGILIGLMILGGGLLFLSLGLRGMVNSLFKTLQPDPDDDLATVVYHRRMQERGPRVVVLGGGTGLATLLRGIKEYTSNITAIVTVTDDGGSSGKIRDEMGILPPGDIRNCLVALAEAEPLMQKLFQYRFYGNADLEGHSFGNLFIAAMSKISGDFETAIRQSSRVLAVRGRVLPSTLANCLLCARYKDGTETCGETNIPRPDRKIEKVYLNPINCKPHPDTLKAIKEAEVIVLGPGSLYTSIIPNLLVKGIPEALRSSEALKIYVCNVMTQAGETQGYDAGDHLQAIEKHSGGRIADYIIVNNKKVNPRSASRYEEEGAFPVTFDLDGLNEKGINVIESPLLDEENYVRHNPQALAREIMELAGYLRNGRENTLLKLWNWGW